MAEGLKLCDICSIVFHSGNPEGKFFYHSNIDQLSPETCPVCAMIRHECRKRQQPVDGISTVRYLNPDNSRGMLIEVEITNGQRYQLLLTKIFSPDANRLYWANNLPDETLSKASILLLKSKLIECINKHTTCGRPGSAYPTRLLRVEILPSSKMYLVESSENTPGPYFTLSHCWGGAQPFKLTSDSEPLLRTGLDVEYLPKTFRDAIYVCQQIGVYYLWIDSLCIFQDCMDDWKQEAARMHTVYAGAACNIAATSAANSDVGLSFNRDVNALQPFWIRKDNSEQSYVVINYCDVSSIERSPLNKRAWVLQERFLSKRIMHFTADGVFWECLEKRASDIFPDSMWSYKKHIPLVRDLREMKISIHGQHRFQLGLADDSYKFWRGILNRYTGCNMTRETDKLIAMNGIVRQIENMTGARMVWGMWDHLLIHELLWVPGSLQIQANFRPSEWRAPTWSWASQNLSVRNNFAFQHSRCSIRQDLASARTINDESYTTSRHINSILVLRGKPLRIVVSIETPEGPYQLKGDESSLHVNSDLLRMDIGYSQYPHSEQLTFVAISKCHCDGVDRPWDSRLAAVMLREQDTVPGTYERVGVLCLKEEEGCEFYMAHESAEEEDVFVV